MAINFHEMRTGSPPGPSGRCGYRHLAWILALVDFLGTGCQACLLNNGRCPRKSNQSLNAASPLPQTYSSCTVLAHSTGDRVCSLLGTPARPVRLLPVVLKVRAGSVTLFPLPSLFFHHVSPSFVFPFSSRFYLLSNRELPSVPLTPCSYTCSPNDPRVAARSPAKALGPVF